MPHSPRARSIALWGAAALVGAGGLAAAVATLAQPGPAELQSTALAQVKPATQKPSAHRHSSNRALHGEFLVHTASGVQTVVIQRGTVTAITASSMTLTSADGFAVSYPRPAAPPPVGAQAHVRAVRNGRALTLTRVTAGPSRAGRTPR
ncbi:MAG: hypothetical protein QOJ50_2903 [Cryptosporangiaceae bacterium]|nr:hypothetical protein [Cryptosporangiaceae bacterium]